MNFLNLSRFLINRTLKYIEHKHNMGEGRADRSTLCLDQVKSDRGWVEFRQTIRDLAYMLDRWADTSFFVVGGPVRTE